MGTFLQAEILTFLAFSINFVPVAEEGWNLFWIILMSVVFTLGFICQYFWNVEPALAWASLKNIVLRKATWRRTLFCSGNEWQRFKSPILLSQNNTVLDCLDLLTFFSSAIVASPVLGTGVVWGWKKFPLKNKWNECQSLPFSLRYSFSMNKLRQSVDRRSRRVYNSPIKAGLTLAFWLPLDPDMIPPLTIS